MAELTQIFVHANFLKANCWKILTVSLLSVFSRLGFMMASNTCIKVMSAKELIGYNNLPPFSASFPVSVATRMSAVKVAWNSLKEKIKQNLDVSGHQHLALAAPLL